MTEKILIIDDDLDTLRLVGLMLQKQGYDIVAANNGEQGLLKAAEEIPDLILLDVMMPDMDGYEVARLLREKPETEGTPILMFTAKSQLDDKVTGFEAGVDDYLTKPTHPTELHAHVKALLARSVKKVVEEDHSVYTLGVIGARGGLGVSTIALNLGSFLNTVVGKETIVAELLPGRGTIGRDLSFSNLDGLSRLLKSAVEGIDQEKVEKKLLEHKSGLRLLLASEEPKETILSDAVLQAELVFAKLSSLTNFLVADFGAGLPALSQSLLPQCDQILIVVEALSNSIAHTKLLIENLIELGIEREDILIVLNNRTRSEMRIAISQVQEELGYPLTLTLMPAPELFAQSIRFNTTAVLQEPASLTSKQFAKLAEIITEKQAKKK